MTLHYSRAPTTIGPLLSIRSLGVRTPHSCGRQSSSRSIHTRGYLPHQSRVSHSTGEGSRRYNHNMLLWPVHSAGAHTTRIICICRLLATWFGRCRRVGLSTKRRPEPTRLQLLAAKETQPVSSSKSRVLTPRSLLMETILQAAIFRGGGCGCQAALDRQLLAAVPAAATYPRAALVH